MYIRGDLVVTDNDFWAELASKQSQINYHDVRENFQWNLPEFYNIGVDISDRHAVDRTRLALIYDREDGHHEKWTYYEISQESNRLANVFLNMHISQRDRIAIFLSQSPQLPIAHIAAYKIGAIAVPLFTLFGSDALAYRINDSGARVLITDSSNLYNVIGIINKLSSLEHIIITDFENVSPSGYNLYHSFLA
jgi:acetyl-CoA synthetase